MDPINQKVAYKIAEQPYHSAPLLATNLLYVHIEKMVVNERWKRKRGANREKSGALFQKQQPFRRLKMRWTRISISRRQEKAGDSNPSGEGRKHRAEPFYLPPTLRRSVPPIRYSTRMQVRDGPYTMDYGSQSRLMA